LNLGILGGTFNPPHNGHLIVAEHVRECLGLERVLFVPSEVSPHKQHVDSVSSRDRLEMVKLAIGGNSAFGFSDVEIIRGGVSYTVETLQELKTIHPLAGFYLLIGMDNVDEFHLWKDPSHLLRLAQVIVMSRPNFTMTGIDPSIKDRVTMCEVPDIGISSSEIRRRVKEGRSIRYLVPDAVEKYIRTHRLYL